MKTTQALNMNFIYLILLPWQGKHSWDKLKNMLLFKIHLPTLLSLSLSAPRNIWHNNRPMSFHWQFMDNLPYFVEFLH